MEYEELDRFKRKILDEWRKTHLLKECIAYLKAIKKYSSLEDSYYPEVFKVHHVANNKLIADDGEKVTDVYQNEVLLVLKKIMNEPVVQICRNTYIKNYKEEGKKDLRKLEEDMIQYVHVPKRRKRGQRYVYRTNPSIRIMYERFMFLMDTVEISKENIHIVWNITLFFKQYTEKAKMMDSILESKNVKIHLKKKTN